MPQVKDNAVAQSDQSSRSHYPRPLHRDAKLSRSQIALQRFSEIIIRAIRVNFPRSSFTRDDVLSLVSQMRLDSTEAWAASGYGVNDIATSTRVHKVGEAVRYLLSIGELTSLDWLRLCLPDMWMVLSQETPLHVMYLATIRRIVQQNFTRGAVLDAMAVVHRWQSDQHLPVSVKRMAVREVLPVLLRERVLRRDEYKQFTVR